MNSLHSLAVQGKKLLAQTSFQHVGMVEEKIMQLIRITSRLTTTIRNAICQFWWTSSKHLWKWHKLATFQRWAKGSREAAIKGPTILHIHFSVAYLTYPRSCPDMTTVYHGRLSGRFIEIKSNLTRKKLHRMNQGSNFLEDKFSNWRNVKAPA